MSRAVPVSPAVAARRAKWFREYATLPGLTAEQVAEHTATAAAYQAMAVTSYVADKHDRSEAVDS